MNGFNCVEGDQTFKLLLNLDKTNFLAGSDSNQSAAHCFFSPGFTNKVVMSSPVPLLGLKQPPVPSNKSFPPIRRDWHHDFFYTKNDISLQLFILKQHMHVQLQQRVSSLSLSLLLLRYCRPSMRFWNDGKLNLVYQFSLIKTFNMEIQSFPKNERLKFAEVTCTSLGSLFSLVFTVHE